jgi:hypothetical protein
MTRGRGSFIRVFLADVNGEGHQYVLAGSYSRGPRDQDREVTVNDRLGRLGDECADSRIDALAVVQGQDLVAA